MWLFIYEGAKRGDGKQEVDEVRDGEAGRLTDTEWGVSEGSRLREMRQYDRC